MVVAAVSAGVRRAVVSLLFALLVAIRVSPAQDEKRGGGHHLIHDAEGAKGFVVLTPPADGCARSSGRYARAAAGSPGATPKSVSSRHIA